MPRTTTRTMGRTTLALVGAISVMALALSGCSNTETSSPSQSGSGSATPLQSTPLDSVKKDDALAARLPDRIKQADVLNVGSDTTFPPAEFMGGPKGDTPVGYDVDLADAIGKKLGVKVSFQTASFDGILPALGSKYDLGVSAFYITKERLKAVNMVSYSHGGSALLVKQGNPEKLGLNAMCGHKVAVQIGSTQQDDLTNFSKKCTASGKKAITVLPLKTNTDALTRLQGGTVDAVLSGAGLLGYAVQTTPGVELIKGAYAQAPDGIAVAKSDPALASLVADTVNSLIKDGTYAKIMKNWGQQDTMITKAQVNPETTL